ncbi:MAG TPA: NAD-dependent epimerase/dehydratase family protein [Xanthomonadaceae bacterium]|nr:NAD-dependent epimerase/dehydratase family protein [Xanthomonadaceae bacterium]
MRHALVFGGSGQIGAALLPRLQAQDWRITAVSRKPRTSVPGLHWLRGELADVAGLPADVDAIFSCGPLDAFACWYATTPVAAARVVAFGSTSAHVKQQSADAAERALAERLKTAEQAVFDAASRQGVIATLLRPTLIYGAGRDRTLTRVAQLAQRWGRFVLPAGADGARQPVHVDDLAAAALAACEHAAAIGRYDLPGGETLPYREMIARVLGTLTPPPRLHTLPAPAFAMLLRVARAAGVAHDLGDAAIARMRADLAFDTGPSQRDFGYAPRAFHPTADMFRAPEQ